MIYFSGIFLLLSGDMNISPGPTTLNSNKFPLDTLSFYNYNEPTVSSKFDGSCNKEHGDPKLNVFKKGFVYFKLEC